MFTTEKEFLEFLEAHGFTYRRVEHPAVFTCAEAELHRPDVPAVSTKNLDGLASQLGVSNLRFASEENLQRILGVTRGAVTMMGLANDTEHRVELWIDAGIWQGEYFQSHPLVNTATLVLSKPELKRFFDLTGHLIHLFEEGSSIAV